MEMVKRMYIEEGKVGIMDSNDGRLRKKEGRRE